MHAPSSGRITRTASETHSKRAGGGAGSAYIFSGYIRMILLLARAVHACALRAGIHACVHGSPSAGSRCPFESVCVYMSMCVCVRVCVRVWVALWEPLQLSYPFRAHHPPSLTAFVHTGVSQTTFWSKDGISANKWIKKYKINILRDKFIIHGIFAAALDYF